MATYRVPDISYAQGNVDWATVNSEFRKGTFHAIILRCGYGDNIASQDDTQWLRNVAACEKYNIPYAVYLYSYAYTAEMARSEAEHVLRLVKGHKPWCIYYDLEEASLGRYAVNMANTFCPIITNAGYRVGVYTYESYFNSFMSGYNKYPLWIAKYSSNTPNINVPYEAWQFTSTAVIPGFARGIDLSYFYKKLWSANTKPTSAKVTVTTEKTVVDKAIEWMEKIANDNSHGYDQRFRWGEYGDYDCSSMVITAWEQAGVRVKSAGATYTGNMRKVFQNCGFKDVTSSVNLANGSGLKRGDVLLNDVNHVAMAVSASRLVQASINENGGVVGGKPGDQTGGEIGFCGYYNYPWNCVLRYGKASATTQTTVTPSTKTVPKITYGVKTLNHGILADVGNGYPLGIANDGIIGIKIGVDSGKVTYRVHCTGRGWLPKVTGNTWNDNINGWAGDGVNLIDGIQIYYETDTAKTGGQYYEAYYGVKAYCNSRYYSFVHDTNWESEDGDHTAGVFGKPFTEIKISLKKC